MVSKVEKKSSSLTPPLLTVTSPEFSVTGAPFSAADDGSAVEISTLGLPAADGTRDSLHPSNIVTVESRSCHDLRPSQPSSSHLTLPSSTSKSTSLPNHQRGRRLSPNAPQGGAIFLQHRRKQKSFDINMLPRDSDEVAYLSRGRSPSPSPEDRASSPTNKVDFCEYVVDEILLTEQQYVRDLEDIVEGYLEYSRTCSHISRQDTTDIFSNIEDIYNFHAVFLRSLEECGEEPVAIAKCFIKHGKEFGIYANYVTNYPSSIASLSKLLRKAVVNDMYRKQQLILGHGLPLGSYLHKPVQRILKYHLLLQNLLKHFGEDTFGRETITNSLQCMTECAHNINELKRSHEHAMKIQEIQSMLYNFEGYNLLDFGKLIIEGNLRMHGAKSFRHLYLFEKGVIICKKREDGAMSCKTTIMCHNLMLIESIPREPLSFHLVPYDNPRLQNTFQAKTLEQKREWCSQVKRYILESYDVKIPEKAKELLLTLTGKSDSDGKVSKHFKAFTLKSHQTPDYIEKKRRKSQPFATPAGDTLPRTKKRVRKASADPRSNPSFVSPPTSRMSRSMSSPVNPEELSVGTTSPSLGQLTFPAVDQSRSSTADNPLLSTIYPLHELNGRHVAVVDSTADVSDDHLHNSVSCDANQSPMCREEDEDINANVHKEGREMIGCYRKFSIPTVEITDVDNCTFEENLSSPKTSHDPVLSKPQPVTLPENKPVTLPANKPASLPASTCDEPVSSTPQPVTLPADEPVTFLANTCDELHGTRAVKAGVDMPQSLAGVARDLFRASSTSVLHLSRRHSLSDLKTADETSGSNRRLSDDVTTPEQEVHSHFLGRTTSYDEDSPRAHELQKLLGQKYGSDNPSWSPQLASVIKRYNLPLIRRTDSYAQAVMQSATLAASCRSLDSSYCDTLELQNTRFCSTRNDSIISDSSLQDEPPRKDSSGNRYYSDSDTLRKGKTETSLLLNKLSQLKERTSSRLSDLLKRSPVKLFKETDLSLHHSDHNESHDSHSIVGRRLSNSNTVNPELSLLQDSNSNNNSQISYTDSMSTLVPEEVEPCQDCDASTHDGEAPPLPLKLRNYAIHPGVNRDSTISLTSTNGDTLERSGTSRQGYSTDNLADVEENDYENVDYGDNLTPRHEGHTEEPIYDTVSNIQADLNFGVPDLVDDEPPALPPLPEFLLKKRQVKAMSVDGDSLVKAAKARNDTPHNRWSVPNNTTVTKPTSDFWVALEKYIETGSIDKPIITQKSRPMRHSETSLRPPVLRSESEADVLHNTGQDRSSENRSSAKRPSSVYKMARKYSTRIKCRKDMKDGGRRRSLTAEEKSIGKLVDEDDNSTTCTSDGAPESTITRPRRVSSIRIRRTNSRVTKFQVMLDSDDEYGSRADSGVHQCDFDSGSDCNDIYEKQTMAALESFGSDDEMRDSAIYSDGEEGGVATPVLLNDVEQRAKTLSPEHYMYLQDDQREGDDTLQDINEFESRRRRCRSLPRSRSLPCHSTSEMIISSVDDIVSRPVSSNLLARLEALKNSARFEKEHPADTTLVTQEMSVLQLTQSLQERNTKTFSKGCPDLPADHKVIAERQKQLSSSTQRLQRQPSCDKVLVGPGLVQQVKEKLHVS